MKSIDERLRAEDNPKKKVGDSKKGDSKNNKKKDSKKKKKDKKREKKSKDKKSKKGKKGHNNNVIAKDGSSSLSALNSKNAYRPPDLTINTSSTSLIEYFDIKSEHCLIPLIPSNNSFNRNMVLTFGHSGVKFIIEKL